MDGQLTGLGRESTTRPPMWLRLRVQHGFASAEEMDRFARLDRNPETEEGSFYFSQKCETSGCQCQGITGGCNPGTACLFTCLQTQQKD